MNREEFIAIIKLNGRIVNVGLDDNGQCYFLEYVNDKKELVQVSCGTYNTNYQWCAEEMLGEPLVDCPYYTLTKAKKANCEHKNKFGYCHRCFYEDINNSMLNILINTGLLDRRLNIDEQYLSIMRDIFKANMEVLELKNE